MNYKLIAHYLSRVLDLLAVLMLLPLMVSLIFRDFEGVRGFLITMAITLAVSVPLGLIPYDKTKMYAKEGFIITALSWIALSAFGALPFLFSGQIPNYVDCLFEAISGFTTTGASILADVGQLSPGLIFWRSFTHWIGGMGVLVFLMAIIPAVAGDRAVHVMKAESPGPAPGKLVPKLRQSSKLLYIIYFALTIVEILFLLAGGMPLFDSVVNAMSTAGTGGFSARNDSIGVYGSLYCEIVITVFMMLFGINFNVFFFLLIRNIGGVLKNEELRVYFCIIIVATALITWNLTGNYYETVGQSLRYAVFQVASFMTTTGFASTNFVPWPLFSKSILFLLMFVGGCSGSTAGGIKVSRIIIMWKECRRAIAQIIRPRSVEVVKLDGKPVDKGVVQSVCYYGIICAFVFLVTLAALSLENYDLETTMSAAATCLNNVGQGFGQIGPDPVGPGAGFVGFSMPSKLLLSFNMLLGRLELYPILLLISPRTWKKV